MLTTERLVQRGMAHRIAPKDWHRITETCSEVRTVPAKAMLSRMGEPLDRSVFLVEGIIARHVPGPHRDIREMVALEVPGDFVDLHAFTLGALDHDVTAITEVRVAVFPHTALRALVDAEQDIAVSLWKLTVIDAAIHRYWSFRIGALRAIGRVANFVCEMEARLRLAGLADDEGFGLPLTQSDLGEACGMSSVHVNRVIRDLREAGCCVFREGRVIVQDRRKLAEIGHFDPGFLYLGQEIPGYPRPS